MLEQADIESAVVALRSRIGRGVAIRRSLVLGADEYQIALEDDSAATSSQPALSIGDGCWIENAIIDKNARVGRNVSIRSRRGVSHHDGDGYFVRDGIVIVPKGGSVPDGAERWASRWRVVRVASLVVRKSPRDTGPKTLVLMR